MHIAHVVTRLLRAGSEENTLATCRWQIEAGHQVSLVHGNMCDPFWADNLPDGVTRFAVPEMVHPLRPRQDARAVRRLRALYRHLQPDVIHTHQSKAGILGRLAASAVPDAAVAHGIHIVPFDGVSLPRRALYIAAERLAARHTDVFIGVSEAVGRAYIRAGIADEVHCVRSGMDLSRFRRAALPTDWRKLLDVPPGQARPPVALMMAAFEPRKRHIPFLRAFAKAAGALPDLKLLLAGRGPEEGRVRAAVAGLGLQDCVVFCGHRPDPEALFALADLAVLSSEREGLPRVAVQSIASGCPLLIQRLPGLSEVIETGRNAVIADPDDMDGFVARMQEMLQTPRQLEWLRQGALSTDLSAWAMNALGAQTTALYAPHLRAALPAPSLVEAA